MIGQTKIKEKLFNKQLPRFMIFEGLKGCGKKTLAKELAANHNLQLVLISNKIDSIRSMIKIANELQAPILFFIEDGDKMSLGAKNTLLKVTEEAPNNVYIILTTENKELILGTLKSRGEVIRFVDYTEDEFREFAKLINYENIEGIEFFKVKNVLPNLSYLLEYDVKTIYEMYNYCLTILKQIREANGANAFKITEKIKLKDTDNGWDLKVFINCLSNLNYELLVSSVLKNKDKKEFEIQMEYAKILTEIKRMLNNTLFNKSFILDRLVIDFKGVK